MTGEGEYLYLPDDPITDEEEDQFRHTEYANTLHDIIDNVDTPWHIGLFGEWGTGKTTIIRLLDKKLESDDSTILVEFDAWKHAEESIRTELLLELDEKLGKEVHDDDSPILGEEKITEELYDVTLGQAIDSVGVGEVRGEWTRLKQFFLSERWLVFSTLIIAGLVLAVDYYVSTSAAVALATVILVPLLIFMAKKLSEVTSTIQRKFLYPRREWSGAYERIFKRLIKVTDKEKIVISVDNLDRCSPETTYDVLISLKSFMDQERCLYIVPCDADALREQVRNIGDGEFLQSGGLDEEFLRKFFNTRISITALLEDDIDDYVDDLVSQLEFSYERQELDVITSALIDNPRHIKESINRLTTLRILAKEMEESGSDRTIHSGQVTGNLPFLAKISILEAEFPDFYKEVQEDPELLDDANRYSRTKSDEDLPTSIRDYLRDEASDREPRLVSFLGSTLTVNTEQIEPFLTLAEPDYAELLEDSAAFENALRSGQIDESREIINSAIREDQNEMTIVRAFTRFLNQYQQQSRVQPFTGTLRVLVNVFEEFNEETQTRLANIVYKNTRRNVGSEAIREQNLKAIMPILDHLDEPQRSDILSNFTHLFRDSSSFSLDDLETILENIDLIPESVINDLNGAITDLEEKDIERVLSTIHQSGRPEFVRPKLHREAIGFISVSGDGTSLEETEFYQWFDQQARISDRGVYVSKLGTILKEYNSGQLQEFSSSFAKEATSVEADIPDHAASKLESSIRETIEKGNNIPALLEPIYYYLDMLDESSRDDFLAWLNEKVIRQWPPNLVREVFELSENYGVEIAENDAIAEFLLGQVPHNFGDENFVAQNLVPQISRHRPEKARKKILQLLRSNDQAELSMGSEIYLANPDSFKESASEIALAAREATVAHAGHNNREKFIEVETTAYTFLEEGDKDRFIVQLLEPLKNGNPQHYENCRKVWDGLEDIPDDTKKTVATETANKIEGLLDLNQDPQHIQHIVDIWLTVTDSSSTARGGELIDSMSQKLSTGTYNINQKEILLSWLAETKSYFGRDETVLNRLSTFLDDESISDQIASLAADVIENLDTSDINDERVEEIRTKLNTD